MDKPLTIIKRNGGKQIKRTEAERRCRITRYEFASAISASDAFGRIRLSHPAYDMTLSGAELTIYR